MKSLKIALAAAALGVFVLPAQADTVGLAFKGMNQSKLIFENGDNGKTMTCTMTGSGAGSVPTGCNWSIGIDTSTMSGDPKLTAGNSVCKIECSSN